MASSSRGKWNIYEHTKSSTGNAIDKIHVKGISIAGWKIETQRGSIADSKTIDECSSQWGIPLPEMPFDKNRLILTYQNDWSYQFDALQALRNVEGVEEECYLGGKSTTGTSKTVFGQKPTKSRRVKVAHANEWGKKREQSSTFTASSSANSSSNFGSEAANAAANGAIGAGRDYDWTYSCTWPGGDVSSTDKWRKGTDPNLDRIPVERLGPPSTPGAVPEPILFYDDVMLFEDELGDNGSSMLSVKIRVMPSGILVLQRFFLRVDNVVFRIFDTRMYVGFDDEAGKATASTRRIGVSSSASDAMSNMSLEAERVPMRVIRECSGCQAKYTDVKARLPPYKPNDLSPLTEPGWVTQQLAKMQEEKQKGSVGVVDDITRPAVLPSEIATGQESNRILGEVGAEGEDDKWKGEGQWIDVLILR
ncbi:hypothetical protein CBS101457_004762 [Exobasidium rhododendri]|nr:hypothetical protein CBS101457_004762 [Exobasidium rhododendri]